MPARARGLHPRAQAPCAHFLSFSLPWTDRFTILMEFTSQDAELPDDQGSTMMQASAGRPATLAGSAGGGAAAQAPDPEGSFVRSCPCPAPSLPQLAHSQVGFSGIGERSARAWAQARGLQQGACVEG